MFTRRLRRLLTLPIALLVLFEEWGWEPARRAMAWLMRWAPDSLYPKWWPARSLCERGRIWFAGHWAQVN